MQFVYFPCISNFTDVQTWDTYCKFRDLYGVLQDHVLEKRMFEMMSQEMKRVGNHEEQIQLFCQCFFDAKSSSSLSLIQNHPEVFRVFLQVLAFLKPHFQKYSEKHWRIYYKYIRKCKYSQSRSYRRQVLFQKRKRKRIVQYGSSTNSM